MVLPPTHEVPRMGEASLLDHPWITRRKLDVAEYHRMGEAGILHEDDRVELIEGELVQMAPIGSLHAGTVNALAHLLITAVGQRAVVAVQNPVRLDRHAEPQPDFAVLRPRDDLYRSRTPEPADVLLLVEVADSSLRYDRTVKLPLYAGHGVPEVWIVDLEQREIEVWRDPADGRYGTSWRAGPDASLEPALLPGVVLRAADILA
jgi:Uma2 family endonuclease